MRPRIDAPEPLAPPLVRPADPPPDRLREAPAVAELFTSFFRRDLLAFVPDATFELVSGPAGGRLHSGGPSFRVGEGRGDEPAWVELFGRRYRVAPRGGERLKPQSLRMVGAIGAVLGMRYHHLFQLTDSARMELYRGGSEDQYVAAYLEPELYVPPAARPSRIAATIQTLRTAALSTYENRRVSTGALLIGLDGNPDRPGAQTPSDALPYGVELTGLKSIHRLCDGNRTLFLVDSAGKLAGIVDVARYASELADAGGTELPCPRTYQPHARATRTGGNTCLALSPNQEIKLFAGGAQAFAFAHGRWRILDPASNFAVWEHAVRSPALARSLLQAALNLAEARQGGLFVVVHDPGAAVERLIAPHDLLSEQAPDGPPPALDPRDPLAKRALHYLARGRSAIDLDPSVLEALACLDGAFVTDRAGRLLAFGAILRHEDLAGLAPAEGARTTAALVASRYGPVLKVSEDGIITCYLDGARAWDL